MDKLKSRRVFTAVAGPKVLGKPSIRVMTYNIHSCVNTDGKVNPERIGAVIEELTPDLVALQEVDAGIPRTHHQEQAKILGETLGMDYRFFPVVKNGDQKYGLAILSRLRFQDVRLGRLPAVYPSSKLNLQKRGVMWAIIETPSRPVHFFNTHLSLYRLERRKQVKALLGEDWLMAVPKQEPVILCGDFNAGPLSPVYRRLSHYLMDAPKKTIHARRPRATFPSRAPFFRIDHIFISRHFRTREARVLLDQKSRLASDHLPLCVDLEMFI